VLVSTIFYTRSRKSISANFNQLLITCPSIVSDSPAVSAAVAFAIGIFIQLVEKLSVILKEHSQLLPEIPVLAVNSTTPIAEVTLTLQEPSIQATNDALDNGALSEESSNPKSNLPKRRRRNGHIISANFLHQDSSSEDDSDNEPNNSRRRRGMYSE